MTQIERFNFKGVLVAVLVLSLLVISSTNFPADNDPIPDADEEALAEMYAPNLYFHPDEKFYPVSPTYAVSRSNLMSTENGGTLISDNPTLEMLDDYTDPTEGIYLDNRKGTIDDDGIEEDFTANRNDFPPTIHSRVTLGTSGMYIIQYWFFYPFNEGPLNTHEGDWEMISIFLDSYDSPVYTAYSQHMGGEQASWGMVNKQGEHPNVYVALGTHANYYRPYEGSLGSAFDKVSDDKDVLGPEDYTIVYLGEKGTGEHPQDQAWLDFAGHWGDYGRLDAGIRGERGPLGPVYFEDGERWDTPEEWADGLYEVNDTWLTVNWLVANILLIILLIMFLILLIIILLKYRLKKKQGTLGPRLFSILYIDGGNLKSIGLILGIIALIIGIVGFFLPWYVVTIDVEAGDYSTPGEVEMLKIDGFKGIQFNMLDSGNGLTQVFGLPIPFLWILLAGVALFLIGTIGIRKSKKMGRKLFIRGIITLIPIILIILFIMVITSVIQHFAGDLPEEVGSVVAKISANPLFGQASEPIGDYGEANLSWGLGLGGWLFIIAMILFLIAGILEISAGCIYFEAKGEEAEVEERMLDKEIDEEVEELTEALEPGEPLIDTEMVLEILKEDRGWEEDRLEKARRTIERMNSNRMGEPYDEEGDFLEDDF